MNLDVWLPTAKLRKIALKTEILLNGTQLYMLVCYRIKRRLKKNFSTRLLLRTEFLLHEFRRLVTKGKLSKITLKTEILLKKSSNVYASVLYTSIKTINFFGNVLLL